MPNPIKMNIFVFLFRRRDLPDTQVYAAAEACEAVDMNIPAKKTAEMKECAHNPPKKIACERTRIERQIMFCGCVYLK